MSIIPIAPAGSKLAAHLDPIVAVLPEIDCPDVALVASYGSLVIAKRRGYAGIILAQHGAGQSYGGDSRTTKNPGYPGGDLNDDVGLFLVPNEYSAGRWRSRYPRASVEVVGCPRLALLPSREPGPGPVIAVAWHWNGYGCPEMRSAADEYWPAVAEIAKYDKVIGTGHPMRKDLGARYKAMGIEWVPDFNEVCRRADVLVADNTSVMYEFASTGRPVVVVNSQHYRREANHGGRFWDWATIGPQVNEPGDLAPAVDHALEEDEEDQQERDRVLDLVYAPWGGADVAAQIILDWVETHAKMRSTA